MQLVAETDVHEILISIKTEQAIPAVFQVVSQSGRNNLKDKEVAFSDFFLYGRYLLCSMEHTVGSYCNPLYLWEQ